MKLENKFLRFSIILSILVLSFQQTASALTFDQIKQAQTQPQVLGASTPTLLDHNKCSGSTCTDGSMNTAGATLLVAIVSEYAELPTTVAPHDTYANTWRALTPQYISPFASAVIYYAYDKAGAALATGSADVVSITGGSSAAMEVMAFSGTLTGSNPLDVQNGTVCTTCSNPQAVGSITPSQSGELVITGYGGNNVLNPPVVSSGFTLTDFVVYGSTVGGGAAYLVQPTAVAVNPTWQSQGNTGGGFVVAAFQSGSSAPGSPTISSFTASPTSITSGQSSTLSWTTSGATTASISPTVGTVATSGSTIVNPTVTTTYTLTATNSSGSLTVTATVTVNSNSPPVISNISSSGITSSSSTISWTTDLSSDSQVEYGTTVSYGLSSVLNSTLVTSHSVFLSSLTASTLYHYRVKSSTNGNLAVSADNTFTTSASGGGGSYAVGWTDLPNTKLQSVCPPNYVDPNNSANNYNFSQCGNLIMGWSGGFFDSTRNRMVLWGGGHSDYSGNELYSLNFRSNPVTLTRLNNPSVPPSTQTNGNPCPEALSDGNPDARHTYEHIVYIPTADRMISFGGGLAFGGCASSATWSLNLSTLGWQRMDPTNGPTPTFINPFNYAFYNPNAGLIYLITGNDQVYSYNYTTNTYTFLKGWNPQWFIQNVNGVFDPKRNMFFIFGTTQLTGTAAPSKIGTSPQVLAVSFSPSDPNAYNAQDWTSQVTGCNNLAGSWSPGLAYDPVLDRIVGWPDFGNTIYVFNPDTKSCTTQTFAGGPSDSLDPSGNSFSTGVYGRFQYVPSIDAFALINYWTNDAYVLKLSSGGSTDTTAPSVPSGINAVASSTSVSLSWTASTDVDDAVSSYTVYRNGSPVGFPITNSFNDVGLTSNTTYSYTISATDSHGNISAQSTTRLVTTTAAASDTTPPTQPTNLAANAISSSQINLTWTASTDDTAVTGYRIYRGGAQVATSTLTSYSDTGLSSSTAYTYTVAAFDAAGNTSTQSSAASATTQAGATGGAGGLLSGSGAPTNTIGNNGDLYHRTDDPYESIYGPKTNGVWPTTFSYIVGQGCTTVYHIDKDCDGYGIGPSTITTDPNALYGPDADDNDAAVNTSASVLSKYGTINAFLTHLGYPTNRVYYIDANNGNDANFTTSACSYSSPCKDWGAVATAMYNGAGGTVIYLPGTSTGINVCNPGPCYFPWATSPSSPTVVMSYPGTMANFVGANELIKGNEGFATNPTQNVIFDGFRVISRTSGAGIGMGGSWMENVTFKNMEIAGWVAGIETSAGSKNVTMTQNLFHDISEHGIYPTTANQDVTASVYSPTILNCSTWVWQPNTTKYNPNFNFVTSNNVFLSVGWGGYDAVHYNGEICGGSITGNVLVNGGGTPITLQDGAQNVTVSNNMIASNSAAGVTLNIYGCDNNDQGVAASQIGVSCDSSGWTTGIYYYPNGESNNKIINNTIWTGVNAPSSIFCTPNQCNIPYYGINIADTSQGVPGHRIIQNTTIQNNIIVSFNGSQAGSAFPQLYFQLNSYPESNPIKNNLLYNAYTGNSSSNVMTIVPNGNCSTAPWYCAGATTGTYGSGSASPGTYNFSQFQAYNTGVNSGNAWGDPKFADVNTNYSTNLGMFNFRLLSGSPAIAAGLSSDAPSVDITGATRGSTPTIGAYEYNSTGTPPPAVPTINSFTASVNPIIVGNSTTLSFSATNATSLSLDNSIGTVTGLTSKVVSPSITTTYTLTATNSNGSVTSTVTVVVNNAPDTTVPTASITSPTSGSTVSGTITVSATASDPTVSGQTTSGLSLVTVSIDGGVFATSTTGTISKSLDTTTLTNGSHTIAVTAKDNAGNVSSASSVAVTVNNVAATKYPRLVTLTSLEGLSAIPAGTTITAQVISPANGAVLETESNLTATSGNYTISFQNTDPQLVNIRITVPGYLSQLLTNIDTTVNSSLALSVPQLLAGDLNNDNTINSLDYSLMNSHFLQNFSSADINKDSLVNSLDFAILKNNYGKSGQ